MSRPYLSNVNTGATSKHIYMIIMPIRLTRARMRISVIPNIVGDDANFER